MDSKDNLWNAINGMVSIYGRKETSEYLFIVAKVIADEAVIEEVGGKA